MTDEALIEPSRDSAGTGDTLRVGRQWWSSKRAPIQQGVRLWLLAVGGGLCFILQLFNLRYTPVSWQQRRKKSCWGSTLGQISQLLQLGSVLKRDKCKWKRGHEKGALAWMKQAIQLRREGRKGRNNCNFCWGYLWMLKNYRKKQESKLRWDIPCCGVVEVSNRLPGQRRRCMGLK